MLVDLRAGSTHGASADRARACEAEQVERRELNDPKLPSFDRVPRPALTVECIVSQQVLRNHTLSLQRASQEPPRDKGFLTRSFGRIGAMPREAPTSWLLCSTGDKRRVFQLFSTKRCSCLFSLPAPVTISSAVLGMANRRSDLMADNISVLILSKGCAGNRKSD